MTRQRKEEVALGCVLRTPRPHNPTTSRTALPRKVILCPTLQACAKGLNFTSETREPVGNFKLWLLTSPCLPGAASSTLHTWFSPPQVCAHVTHGARPPGASLFIIDSHC